MSMKKINVETLVPDTFQFLARDMDGKLFAFENEPSIATDIACDNWDVKEGKFFKLHNQFFFQQKELPIQELVLNWETGEIP